MHIVSLDSLQEGGEKALNLAKLLQKGLPVPQGFVIRGEAFQGSSLPEEVWFDVKKEYEELSIDKDMKEIGEETLNLIRAGREQSLVAVRGNGAAKLNIHGLPQLKQAIQEVRAAGSGDVIVQKMVNSEKSGCLFPHPTGKGTLVESCWGLCLPEGVTPDIYLATEEGIQSRAGKKEFQMKRDSYSDSTIREQVPSAMQGKESLSNEEVKKLLEMQVQADLPVLDFAFQRGKLWIVQASSFQRKEFQQPDIKGELLVQGEVIVPGTTQGKLRKPQSIEDLETVGEGDIIAVDSLRDEFLKRGCSGFIVSKGSLCRLGKRLKVPGLRADISRLEEGKDVLLDGVGGGVYSVQSPNPIPESKGKIGIKISLSSPGQEIPEGAGALIRAETILTDGEGHPSSLARESPEGVVSMLEDTLESLGRKLFPKPLWYRAFEGRSDEMQGFGAEQEKNPLLGWHGTRRAIEDPLFACELEALRRLYHKGLNNILLILPFISGVEEFRKARERISFPLKLGVMIETPAAALGIEDLCREGVFAAQADLDTLTQLCLGMDAENPRFSTHFSSLNPAVELLLKRVIEACKKYRVETCVHGEACNSPEVLRTLEGIGVLSIGTDNDNLESLKRILQGTSEPQHNSFKHPIIE
ncbi:MAG: hypothetical protein ISS93_02535 [Candidatus Aenigmarchaeota archaeon]|nr:hypothetical protein [Candidatus Aenigmarchaeota archaeon]